jgi:bifunctional enzyme CysN/CysC
MARLLAESSTIAIVSLVSPYERDRRQAAVLHAEVGLPFLEVFVDTPVQLCERRDPKGLYARARAGEISGLTGVDAPYERPSCPGLVLHSGEEGVEASVDRVLQALSARVSLPAPAIS